MNNLTLQILLLMAFIVKVTLTVIYNQSLLPTNYVVNGGFQLPVLPSGWPISDQMGHINGWACAYICQILSIPLKGLIVPYIQNGNHQVLDLQSQSYSQLVYQFLYLPQIAIYLLQFDWLAPPNTSQGLYGKAMFYSFNGKQISRIIINESNYIFGQLTHEQAIVIGITGLNILYFQDCGLPGAFGIRIDNVQLHQVQIDMLIQVNIQAAFNNTAVSVANKIPGSRVLMSGLLNFMYNFDRLQLYYFIHLEQSAYAMFLIDAIQGLQNSKGVMLQQLLTDQLIKFRINLTSFEQWVRNLDFKQNITESWVLQKNQNGWGFIGNNINFFMYFITGNIIIWFVMFILFKILFNYKISIIFRKFSFPTVLLLMSFEGNVQYLTFFTISQFTQFFSTSFIHKYINSFIIFFFYLCLFFAFASTYWFKTYYDKRIRYFYQNYKISLRGLTSNTIQCGLIPITFGFCHRILLDQSYLKLKILFFLQSFLIVFRLWCLQGRCYKYRSRGCINCISGLLRLCLIIEISLYSANLSQVLLFTNIDKHIAGLYIIAWGVQMMFQVGLWIKGIIWEIKNYVQSMKSDHQLQAELKLMRKRKKKLTLKLVKPKNRNKNEINREKMRGAFKTKFIDMKNPYIKSPGKKTTCYTFTENPFIRDEQRRATQKSILVKSTKNRRNRK